MNQNTLDLMKKMKFNGMLNAFKSNLESASLDQFTTDELV